MKVCTKCRVALNETEFCKRFRNLDGLKETCRTCCKKVKRTWGAKNRPKIKAYSRKYLDANRPQIQKLKRLYRKRHPERARAQVKAAYEKNKYEYMKNTHYRIILQKFGLTREQVDAILEKQGHVCKICREPQKCGKRTRLYADHCHETNQFRGFLCFSCNSMLGFAKDNIFRLQAGMEYLENAMLKQVA